MVPKTCLKSILQRPKAGLLRSGQRFRTISTTELNKDKKKVVFAMRRNTIKRTCGMCTSVHSTPKQSSIKKQELKRKVTGNNQRKEIKLRSKGKQLLETLSPEVKVVRSPSGNNFKFNFSINKKFLPGVNVRLQQPYQNISHKKLQTTKAKTQRQTPCKSKAKKAIVVDKKKNKIASENSTKQAGNSSASPDLSVPLPLSQDNVRLHDSRSATATKDRVSSWVNDTSNSEMSLLVEHRRKTSADKMSEYTHVKVPRRYIHAIHAKVHEMMKDASGEKDDASSVQSPSKQANVRNVHNEVNETQIEASINQESIVSDMQNVQRATCGRHKRRHHHAKKAKDAEAECCVM